MIPLKDKILRALYGGALVTTGLGLAACSDDTSSNGGGSSQTSASNTTASTNQTTGSATTGNTTGGTNTASSVMGTASTSNSSTGATATGSTSTTSTSGTNTSTNNTSTNNTSTSTSSNTGTSTPTAPPPACDPAGKTRVPFPGLEVKNPSPGVYVLCDESKEGFKCADPVKFTTEEKQDYVDTALSKSCVKAQYNEANNKGVPGTFCGPVKDPNSTSPCCYVVDMSFFGCVVVGRPFTIDGMARLAQVSEREGWHDDMVIEGLADLSEAVRQELAVHWAQGGIHEHASVASFGRFLLDLMAVGAPRKLVSAATKAIDDEIRHASACFGLASAYAGTSLGPAEVDMTGSMEHAGDLAKILDAAIIEGCIGETLAASVAGWQAGQVGQQDVAAVLEQITQEESDHALLAWEFVQWMLQCHPELVEGAKATFALALVPFESQWIDAPPSAAERLLIRHGKVGLATEERLHKRAMEEVVTPCMEALFAGLAHNEQPQLHA